MTAVVRVLRVVSCLLVSVAVVLMVLATTPVLQLEGLHLAAVVVTAAAGLACLLMMLCEGAAS